jgi:uncharacterized protein YndB with AHSA1/START domain
MRMSNVDGQLEKANGSWQLRFQRRLPHPPEEVWRALTEPEHLRAWFPAYIEGERRTGAPLRFVHREGEGPPIDGQMIAYDPPWRLEMGWGDGETLRFDLEPDGDGTLLTFMNTLHVVGKAARDAASWHSHLDVLAYHLDGREPPWTPIERWRQVYETYVGRFGPEAATIGPPRPHRPDNAMADGPTCGQGLAEHSRLPLKLADLFDHSAENLEVHVDALDSTDEHARTERDVWLRVAAQHRSIAARLRATGELMAQYRDLPMVRHDVEALSSSRVIAAFERFAAAEQAVAELLADWVERDQAMLLQARRAAGQGP